jgi:hypothetical protein
MGGEEKPTNFSRKNVIKWHLEELSVGCRVIAYKEAGCENVKWINLAQEGSNGGLL